MALPSCPTCGNRRSRCTCEPKCEFHVSDQVTADLSQWLKKQAKRRCRDIGRLGPGYKLAVQLVREPPNRLGHVVYQLRTCVLIPGQNPPEGFWTLHEPWS